VCYKFSHEEVRYWNRAATCTRFRVGPYGHLSGRLDGDLADLELPASEVHRPPWKTGGFTPAQASATPYRRDCPMV
jgi:hypothetical protein